ncbi:MAG: sigma-70 family RNA polymerase sigma factor [Bacteroidetes bacterium]|nr:MAG: sigma-70 family RNA polymerase sigma factor [Bacteroidota bacterium]
MPIFERLQHHTSINTLSDQQLVALYRESGEQNHLAVLYGRYAGLLYGVCYKYLKSNDLAQDACADVYEQLVTKLRKYAVENFSAWLHTLARNHCLQQLRQQKQSPVVEMQDHFVQLEDNWHLDTVMEKEEHLNQLQQCLEGLNADQRNAVELFYLQQKSYSEIEKQTGMGWNMVRSHIQNGRRNLKQCMEQHSRG